MGQDRKKSARWGAHTDHAQPFPAAKGIMAHNEVRMMKFIVIWTDSKDESHAVNAAWDVLFVLVTRECIKAAKEVLVIGDGGRILMKW